MDNPAFASLGDAELHARIGALVAQAGGQVVDLRIGPRPQAQLPSGMPHRLSRYTDGVKQTVATRMFKERMGLGLIQAHEAAAAARYTWIMWTREDSHWFAPFQIEQFSPNEVHGKACGGFGGWRKRRLSSYAISMGSLPPPSS